MNTEDFRAKYTLLKRLTEDGVTTYTARDVSGRIVMVHFVDDASPDVKSRLIRGIADLTPRDAVKIVERTKVGDAALVVTQYLEGFTTFERWVAERVPKDAPSRGVGDTTEVDLPVTVQGSSHQPPSAPAGPAATKKAGEFPQLFGGQKADPAAAETLRLDAIQPSRPPTPTVPPTADKVQPSQPREKKAGEFTQLFGQQAVDSPAGGTSPSSREQSPKPVPESAADPSGPERAAPAAPEAKKAPGEFTRMFEPVSPPPASPPHPASPKRVESAPPAEPPKQKGAGDFTKMFGALADAPPPAPAAHKPAPPLPERPAEPVQPAPPPPPPAAKKPGEFTQLFGSADAPPTGREIPQAPASSAGSDPSQRKPKVRWKKRGPAGAPPAPPSPSAYQSPPAPGEPSFSYGAPPPGPSAPPDPIFETPKSADAPLFGRPPAEKRPGEFTQLFGSAKGGGDPARGGDPLRSGPMNAGPKPIGRQSMDYLQALSEGMIDPGQPPRQNRPPEPQAPPKPRDEMPPVPQGPSEFTRIVSAVPGPPGGAGAGQNPPGAQAPPPGMNLEGGQPPAAYPAAAPQQAPPPQAAPPPMAYAPPPQQAPAQPPQQQAASAQEKKIPVWVWIVIAVVVVLSLALIVWALV